MAEFLANLTNGQIDEKGFLRLLGTMLTQSGVVQSGALLVAAQGTPDMTIKVAGAATGHDIVFIASDGATYHGWNTADKNVTISSNATGVTKKDAIVAYADLTAGSGTSNNPGALKFIAVRGSGTNTAPDDTQIQASAVGTNPYVVLSHVTVSNGASSINSGNISDQRPRSYVSGSNVQLVNGTVTSDKIADRTRTVFGYLQPTASATVVGQVGATISLADESTQQALFSLVMPKDAVSGGATLVVYYSSSSTGNMNITLYVGTKAVSDSVVTEDEYNGVNQTLAAANANTLYKATFSLTSVAADEIVGGAIVRRTGDATTGVLRVRAVGVEYTADS